MISGKATAKTQAEADHPENGLVWYCEETPDQFEPEVAKMPTRACRQHMRFSLLFPNCVNPDDITEYAFSNSATNKCPEGMKRMPQLRFSARYDTNAMAPNGWEGDAPFQLSCSDTPGAGYCFHGDFINGWYEDAAEDMMVGGGTGRDDGRFISGARGSSPTPASCTPTDQDPENGTSDYWTSLEMMDGVVELNSDSVVNPIPSLEPEPEPTRVPGRKPTSPSRPTRFGLTETKRNIGKRSRGVAKMRPSGFGST